MENFFYEELYSSEQIGNRLLDGFHMMYPDEYFNLSEIDSTYEGFEYNWLLE